MVTLILPGYSAKNKEWSEAVSKNIRVEGQIRPIFWDHWEDPAKKFKVKEKARLLGDISENLVVNIVAKSVGCLVASYIIQAHPDQIGKVVFCGLPLNDFDEADKEAVKVAVNTLSPEKIICYQNEDDPHGNYDQVKDFMDKAKSKIKTVEKNRDDHEYPYYEDFNNFLS